LNRVTKGPKWLGNPPGFFLSIRLKKTIERQHRHWVQQAQNGLFRTGVITFENFGLDYGPDRLQENRGFGLFEENISVRKGK